MSPCAKELKPCSRCTSMSGSLSSFFTLMSPPAEMIPSDIAPIPEQISLTVHRSGRSQPSWWRNLLLSSIWILKPLLVSKTNPPKILYAVAFGICPTTNTNFRPIADRTNVRWCSGSQMITSAKKSTLCPIDVVNQLGSKLRKSCAMAKQPSRLSASSAPLLERTRAKGYLDFPEIQGFPFLFDTFWGFWSCEVAIIWPDTSHSDQCMICFPTFTINLSR